MFNLSGSKVIFIFLLVVLLTGGKLWGQNPNAYSERNMPEYDERKLHYGFSMALHNSRFEIVHSNAFVQGLNDTVLNITPQNNTSFTLGFIMNFALKDQLDIRLEPGTVSFYARAIDYEFAEGFDSGEKPTRLIESTMMEMPVLVKYKSVRHKNFRMFVVGGIKPGIAINNKRKNDRESILRVKSADLAIEYGFGLDIYYPMFKWSPEIRFSHGIPNRLVDDNNVYARSLQRLSTHTVTLYFHFE